MDSEEQEKGGDLRLPGGNRIPASEIEELASRSGGPGGQHVNTSSTRVTLRWNLRHTRGLNAESKRRAEARLRPKLSRDGTLIVHTGRHRSRERNRTLARERLQQLVADALFVPPPRRPTRPSAGSKARRLDAKRQRGQLKADRRRRPSRDD